MGLKVGPKSLSNSIFERLSSQSINVSSESGITIASILSTMDLELIRFVKDQIVELEPKDSDGDEKDP
ncbi:hypothetical protein Tco_1298507 [Tanacetum coccineum]